MKINFKKIFLTLFIAFLLFIITIGALYWQRTIMANMILRILNSELGDVAKIEYRALHGNLFEEIRVLGLKVSFQNGSELNSNFIRINYNLRSVLSSKYYFSEINIDSLNFMLKTPPEEPEPPTEEKPKQTIQESIDKTAELLASGLKNTLEGFPYLTLDRLSLNYGRFEFPEKEMTIDDIQFDSKVMLSKEKAEVYLKKVQGYWIEKDYRLNHFRILIDATPERMTLNKLQFETPQSSIYATFETTFEDQPWMIANVEHFKLDFLELKKIFAIPDIDSGLVSGTYTLVGNQQNLSTKIAGEGFINQYRLDSLVVDGDYKDGSIFIRRGKVTLNESALKFNGKISDNGTYISINYNQLNIRNFVPDAIFTQLTGKINFNLASLNFKNITGKGEWLLVNSVIDTVRIDTLRFALKAKNSDFDIIEPSFLKFGKEAVFSVRGNLSRSQIVNAELSTRNLDLVQLTSALGVDTIQGYFDGFLNFNGNLFDPDIYGELTLPWLTYQDLHLDSIKLEINLVRALSRRLGESKFSIAAGKYQEYTLTEAAVLMEIDSNFILLDTLRFASGESYIGCSGIVEQISDTVLVDLNYFKLKYENYWIENKNNLVFTFTPQEYSIEEAIFRAPEGGFLEIRGYWDNELRDAYAGIQLDNFRVEPFQQFVNEKYKFTGAIRGDIELFELINNPEIDAVLDATQISFNQVAFGDVDIAAGYRDGFIQFDKFEIADSTSLVQLNGVIVPELFKKQDRVENTGLEETGINLTLKWQNIKIEKYKPLFNSKERFSGTYNGSISVGGEFGNPSGRFQLNSLATNYGKFNLDTLNLSGHFNSDSIVVDDFSGILNKTMFRASGWQIADLNFVNPDTAIFDKPFHMRLFSTDNSIQFIGELNDQVEKLNGPYNFDIAIGGTIKKPAVKSGFFNMEKGTLTLSRVRNPIRDINLNVQIEDSVLTFRSFSGYSVKKKDFLQKIWSGMIGFFNYLRGKTTPEGYLAGTGTIKLRNVVHPVIDLNIEMNKFYVNYFVENTELLVTTNNLHITGRDTTLVSGNITIEEGTYVVDLGTLQKNIYLTQATIEKGRAVAWDLDIYIPGNFNITSSPLDLANNFQFKIMGDLRSIQEPHALSMDLSGNLEMLSGKYGSWGQNFEIQNGSIDFTNPKVINPKINIIAEKRMAGNIIELTIVGDLEQQQQDLQVRDANGNYMTNLSFEEKLSYLSVGSGQVTGDGIVVAGEGIINTSVETMIERGAETFIGLDRVDFEQTGSLVDLRSMKLNNGFKDASVSFGKYLSSNLYLEYRSQLGDGVIPAPKLAWEPGNQLGLTYKINRSWSVESLYEQTQRGNQSIQIFLAWKTTF